MLSSVRKSRGFTLVELLVVIASIGLLVALLLPAMQQGLLFDDSNVSFADILDGSSNTFLAGELSWENAGCFRMWNRGCHTNNWCGQAKNVTNAINLVPNSSSSSNFSDVSFGSQHPGGTHFLMADGAVLLVSENVAMSVYRATASRDGSEPNVVP